LSVVSQDNDSGYLSSWAATHKELATGCSTPVSVIETPWCRSLSGCLFLTYVRTPGVMQGCWDPMSWFCCCHFQAARLPNDFTNLLVALQIWVPMVVGKLHNYLFCWACKRSGHTTACFSLSLVSLIAHQWESHQPGLGDPKAHCCQHYQPSARSGQRLHLS